MIRRRENLTPSPAKTRLGPVMLMVMLLLPIAPPWAWSQDTAGDAAKTTHDWPQFLGPQRTGVSAETGLLDAWPGDGLTEVWRIAGGAGMSGLVVSKGRLITLVQKDGKQFAVAVDALTGKPVWQTALADAYKNAMGNGPRATPTIAGDVVYTFTGEGVLAALKLDSGEVIWRHDVVGELGGEPAEYGMACSPLVVGDRVIVTAGAPDAAVVALDRATGKRAWKAGNDSAGYSSPALLNVGGREQVVVFCGASVLGVAPATGAILWRYPYKTSFDCNIATPLAVEGNVFISSGEDHGCAMLSLQPAGDAFTVKELWTSQGKASVMRNGWQTSILWKGQLYGMDNVGAATSLTHLNCIDPADGKLLWQEKRFGNGNLIAADGKLILTTAKGEVVFVRLSPEKYDEIGRSKVLGPMRQGPALANGLLYVRDDHDIACLDVRKK